MKTGKSKKLSSKLEEFIGNIPSSGTTLEKMKSELADNAYGLIIFILALPNLIPAPAPGVAAVLGAPLILLSGQFVIGRKALWLPKFMNKKKISKKSLESMYKKVAPSLKFIERKALKPRMQFMISPPMDRVIALVCFVLSVLLALPIPFSNAFPAFAVCLLALAILMHDGLMAIIGLVTAFASIVFMAAIVMGVASGLESLFS